MAKNIAYCGLDCVACLAYIATQADDDERRREVAEKWSKEYNIDVKPEDINCDGCIAEGRHVHYCSECPIRKCGQEQGVINCAWCDKYSCDKTEKFFKVAPACRQTLDAIKQWMSSQ